MLLILLILAIIARFATNYSNWKIALGLTAVVFLFAQMADRPNYNAHIFFAILFSPAIYGICHLVVAMLGWLKSKVMRPSFGRNA